MGKAKSPIFGMLQCGGEVVIRMLENVQQATIGPLMQTVITTGSQVYTDEYEIYARLADWGFEHHSVCQSQGEYARDENGDGFHEIHVNTIEGFWSLFHCYALGYAPSRHLPGEAAVIAGLL